MERSRRERKINQLVNRHYRLKIEENRLRQSQSDRQVRVRSLDSGQHMTNKYLKHWTRIQIENRQRMVGLWSAWWTECSEVIGKCHLLSCFDALSVHVFCWSSGALDIRSVPEIIERTGAEGSERWDAVAPQRVREVGDRIRIGERGEGRKRIEHLTVYWIVLVTSGTIAAEQFSERVIGEEISEHLFRISEWEESLERMTIETTEIVGVMIVMSGAAVGQAFLSVFVVYLSLFFFGTKALFSYQFEQRVWLTIW